jgi:hypothetical protein
MSEMNQGLSSLVRLISDVANTQALNKVRIILTKRLKVIFLWILSGS